MTCNFHSVLTVLLLCLLLFFLLFFLDFRDFLDLDLLFDFPVLFRPFRPFRAFLLLLPGLLATLELAKSSVLGPRSKS